MLDLSVQIVNYNTKKYLPDCVDGTISDLENSSLSYKILILDNNSQDDLSSLKEKYKSRNVAFYYSEKNLGFGAGHNFLARKAESKFILILNPDIKFLEKNTVKHLIEKLAEFSSGKVIGPKLITEESRPQEWDHGELEGFKAWLFNNTGNSFWKEREGVIKASWVSGAFFLIERQIFEKVSGFDEKFFLYKEEEDLCLRVRKLGFEIIYCPEVKVYHYGSVVARKEDFMSESRKYFIEKHFKNRFYYPILKLFAKIVID